MIDLPFLTNLLLTVNDILASAVLIVSFSLLVYLVLQNRYTPIARALAVLLGSIVVVFGGDVLTQQVQREETLHFLLRAQWLGIVGVPAGYIHLADALLDFSGQHHLRRRWSVPAAYVISAVFLALAWGTDLVLRNGVQVQPVAQFNAGPLFWVFTLYFTIACLAGLATTLHVRDAALTPTLRRRITYLSLTFVGPAIAVYPFLIIPLPENMIPFTVVLFLVAVGNVAVLMMTTVMVYSIAFQGLPLPDRLIKQDFIRWVLYGPFVGVSIALFLRATPILARWLGLPEQALLTAGVVIMTVIMPLFVNRLKPYLDALVYAQDHAEIDYLRALPRNTFTQADLRSLLENTLVVACGALRSETGFVAAPDDAGGYTVKTLVGSRQAVRRFVNEHPLTELMMHLSQLPVRPSGDTPPAEAFLRVEGFWLLPLRTPDGALLGCLGIAYPHETLSVDARRLIGALTHRMELALETVQMQQRLFNTLRGLAPDMQSLQHLSTQLEQATPASLQTLESDVASLPEFPQLVKEALAHYWGGPKLSESPLLGLRTVRRVLEEQGGSPTRALQAVLRQAIENLRPDAQLDPSAQEWLLYNILEMRFLQGRRIRETADRLAMSESDLYRKQRIAVEEVARQLALMEESANRAMVER